MLDAGCGTERAGTNLEDQAIRVADCRHPQQLDHVAVLELPGDHGLEPDAPNRTQRQIRKPRSAPRAACVPLRAYRTTRGSGDVGRCVRCTCERWSKTMSKLPDSSSSTTSSSFKWTVLMVAAVGCTPASNLRT